MTVEVALQQCELCRDQWTWMAVYNDGSILLECAGSGSDHNVYADIDLPRVVTLGWLPRQDHLRPALVQVTPAYTPILFRRRLIEIQVAEARHAVMPTVHCIGFERPADNNTVGSYTFLLEDGSVITSDNRNAV